MPKFIKPIFSAAMLAALLPAIAFAQQADILPVPLSPVVDADKRQCAAKTKSGLGYRVLRAGNADRVTNSDVVLVNYIGYLAATGEVFDQNAQSIFAVDGVIAGFSEGLKRMGKGAIQRLCIPAKLGYGARATGSIPANSDLVFQVELVEYISKKELEKEQRAARAEDRKKSKEAAKAAKELADDAAEASGTTEG